ncbi:MAG TPA: dual specificity protein phosphatase family protein [Pirellulaceae bacterium]|nr:dual specificity protein phosphatase family protein [Pirellulaceae bacterium]HMO90609.1 dual specificity protein phosphatase family protein [Pirellulaceae bacterium]HMP67812.1 dual specificity protein phosphatase family protein [Pirellulaceae bacterium]
MQWLKIQFLFRVTLLWNVILGRWLRIRDWWTQIDEHVYLGALPFSSDVDTLYNLGVRAVVNTCLEYEGPLAEYERLGIQQCYIPTQDFTHPTLADVESAVNFIDDMVRQGHKVYVHCKAGRARSATILLCWMCRHYHKQATEIQQLLLEKRPHVNPRIKDRPVVKEFLAINHLD